MPGQYPSFTRLSLWQMPQACTRMRTCPAVGLGISRSTISKSAPGFGTSATFIFAIETLRFFIPELTPARLMHGSCKPTHFQPCSRPGEGKVCGAYRQKSFAEISEAMHRDLD